MKKYKILGNHDYGEYVPWKTDKEKQANLQRLIKLQRDIGFDLLLDKGGEIGSDFIRCIDNIYRSKGGVWTLRDPVRSRFVMCDLMWVSCFSIHIIKIF